VALKEGRVVRGTNDGYLLALDAATGELLWEKPVADANKGESLTMPPVIYEDLAIIGPAGSENAIKGWIGAFRLADGQPVWRFNTVPGAGEPGTDTWREAPDKVVGGGAIWTPLSLDPAAGLVYVPVTNPAPDFYGAARRGDNLYTNSMVVLHARSGALRWYYQLVPHDTHDWDLTQVSPLFTTTVKGKPRQLVAAVGKSGLLHVLDRETQALLYQVPVTSRRNVDVALTGEGVHACPGVLGGVQWNGPAYNPKLNMLYVPAVDWCGTYKLAEELRFVRGKLYMGGKFEWDPVAEAHGWLTAIDAASGAMRWRYRSSRPMLAAVTTTSAELIFTGELTGDFIVLDARDGTVLYRFNTGGPLNGGVITYAIEGRQYAAAMSGNATFFWKAPPGSATVVLFALP
jgi:alcohol dehydrogenase (cytochrome c)